MDIIEPIAITDADYSRASTATYYNSAGLLVTAAVDAMRISYNPSDLTEVPELLYEAAGTNLILYSEALDNAAHSTPLNLTLTANYTVAPDGATTADRVLETTANGLHGQDLAAVSFTAGVTYTFSIYVRSIDTAYLALYLPATIFIGRSSLFDMSSGTIPVDGTAEGVTADIISLPGGWYRCSISETCTTSGSARPTYFTYTSGGISFVGDVTRGLYVWGAQTEVGAVPTSYIPTTSIAVTRAADTVADSTGTFLISNVAENDYTEYSSTKVYATGDFVMTVADHKIYEALLGSTSTVTITIASPGVVSWTAHGLVADTAIQFSTTGALPTGLVAATTYYVKAPNTNDFTLAATVGGAAINTSGSQSGVHTARAGANLAKTPSSNPTYWSDEGYTNRWKMFDGANNTQTTNTDSIIVELTPQVLARGIYLGGLDASSVTVTVVDALSGVVFTETRSLVVSDSTSSFWRWCFGRITRNTAYFSIELPLYADPTIQVIIEKTGSTAKCGICAVGYVNSLGFSQLGSVQTDIKDYSTTQFNFDGTSDITERGFSKRMNVDVIIDNTIIDSVQNLLTNYRQTNVVWIASNYESTALYGKYSSFKNVISYPTASRMALQIEGVV